MTDYFIQQNLLPIFLNLKQNYSHQTILVIDIWFCHKNAILYSLGAKQPYTCMTCPFVACITHITISSRDLWHNESQNIMVHICYDCIKYINKTISPMSNLKKEQNLHGWYMNGMIYPKIKQVDDNIHQKVNDKIHIIYPHWKKNMLIINTYFNLYFYTIKTDIFFIQ